MWSVPSVVNRLNNPFCESWSGGVVDPKPLFWPIPTLGWGISRIICQLILFRRRNCETVTQLQPLFITVKKENPDQLSRGVNLVQRNIFRFPQKEVINIPLLETQKAHEDDKSHLNSRINEQCWVCRLLSFVLSLDAILCPLLLLRCMTKEDSLWKRIYLLPGKLVPSLSEEIVCGKQVKEHLSNVKTKF